MELDKSSPEVLQGYANFLISKQQPEEALKHLKESIEKWKGDEENFPPYIFRMNTAKLLIELNEHKEATSILERLTFEDSEMPEPWYLLSLCYYDDLEACKECLEKASDLFGKANYDDAPDLKKQIDEALEKVNQALSKSENVAEASDNGEEEGDPESENMEDSQENK